ncbi:SUMF1/EgtB/PvdO family nonheme iron enzyme [Nodularia harveyana UHCC-0300]|uniref:SUMF1/EgtB/PvdO family nonheme iron enzyme n=1 Tax=Nodularia harveyana UHCC-0300 TaxID=2974287 RepID=A0ABU5UDM6_9CYAN|nr:SUMF1/EgtB/PvdO family nonheme iron enzyme [Nodularia harveyana]MEA5581106.1 SUMF1/EgtB/PvdO family nonheme iron enzyme [Nodularia harveyana UHCC-0300]
MNKNIYVKKILILAANPDNTIRLRLDREVKEIDEGLRRAKKREQFQLEQRWAVSLRDFYRAILDVQPQIVHFCGHGAGQDGIVLEDETGQVAFVPADVLASMFKLFAQKGVECVVLNACYSELQAQAVSQYVNYVIGMNKAVGDQASIAFAVAFYDAIGAGEEVEFAYDLGCSQMIGFLEHQTPVLKKKELIELVNTSFNTEIIPPNPYQGLSAFEEEDAPFFFGQEKFVDSLVQAIDKQPLVAVVGPSGSGKSSVVFAGLVPQLRNEENWLIESFRPGNEPFYQLAFALVRQLEPEVGETQQLREAVGLASDMQQGKITLQQVMSRIIELNPNKRCLLIADQFEELYTLCQIKEAQESFADTLLNAFQQEHLTLVLTLRADFYGYVLSHRPFRDALQQFTPQLLSSMSQEELRSVIEQPAHKLEVQLESQLTQRILDDVGQEPGNLPLLEFALTRLWKKQQNRVLTHQAYDEIGGVKKAIADHATQVYQQLSKEQQQQAQRIFVQLVHPGQGTEDTRCIATRAEVGENNWGLVSYLAGHQARLLVTGNREQEDTVEVVHEALIREWETLQKWINANRQFRTWQERLKVALQEWKNSKHDTGALLRGVPLATAEDWLDKRTDELTQEERDFIQVSAQQRDREKQEQENRRQHELALERQAKSRLQYLVVVLSAIASITTGILAYPLVLRWQAARLGEMVTISSGEFIFGTDDPKSDLGEQPERTVYLPEFEIEKYEVSNRQYHLCVRAGDCYLPVKGLIRFNDKRTLDHPVVGVTVIQANQYCRWLGRRLPTELEWERTARGLEGHLWPWGNKNPTPKYANIVIGKNEPRNTKPVKSYPEGRSMEGEVHNLVGNVWEWTASYSDWSSDSDQNKHIWDGQVETLTWDKPLALRGGNWKNIIPRITYRTGSLPDSTYDKIGIRCAK